MTVWVLFILLRGMPYWGGPAFIDGFSSQQKCQAALVQMKDATDGTWRVFEGKCVGVKK